MKGMIDVEYEQKVEAAFWDFVEMEVCVRHYLIALRGWVENFVMI